VEPIDAFMCCPSGIADLEDIATRTGISFLLDSCIVESEVRLI
jgi:hypothetical protein